MEKKTNTVENTQIQRQIHFARCHIHLNTKCQNLVLKEKFGCSKKNLVLKEKFGINLASKGPPKGPPMKNLVCNEKFGINCASAEAQFGTGRGIIVESRSWRDRNLKFGPNCDLEVDNLETN